MFKALLKLYESIIRPHLENASCVWDPHLLGDIQQLENVQMFGLRVCTKCWNDGYDDPHYSLDRSSLKSVSSLKLLNYGYSNLIAKCSLTAQRHTRRLSVF